MYKNDAKTKHHFTQPVSEVVLVIFACVLHSLMLLYNYAFSPLRPLPRPHTEPREPISPLTLQQLALEAVPNPGETARQFLPPWH